MSPVQPNRSSLCGQSVEYSIAADHCPSLHARIHRAHAVVQAAQEPSRPVPHLAVEDTSPLPGQVTTPVHIAASILLSTVDLDIPATSTTSSALRESLDTTNRSEVDMIYLG